MIPKWALNVVANTLQEMKNFRSGKNETCMDRDINQSLKIVNKILSGQELDGLERLSKDGIPDPVLATLKNYYKRYAGCSAAQMSVKMYTCLDIADELGYTDEDIIK